MKFSIPEIPPSWNRYAGRQNSWEYRREKQRWSELVQLAVICSGKRPAKAYAKAQVRITYFFPTKGRRDPDNYSGKFILDGLTAAGIIADDSFGCIDLVLAGRVDRKEPRTEIIIKEV